MRRKDKVIPILGNKRSAKNKNLYENMKVILSESADKEEERLLNDPALKNVTAPDELLAKILGGLREQGKLRSRDMRKEVEHPEVQEAVIGLSSEDREALLLGRMVKATGIETCETCETWKVVKGPKINENSTISGTYHLKRKKYFCRKSRLWRSKWKK